MGFLVDCRSWCHISMWDDFSTSNTLFSCLYSGPKASCRYDTRPCSSVMVGMSAKGSHMYTAMIQVFCVSTNKHIQIFYGKTCEIWGSQNSVATDLGLLGCDTVWWVVVPDASKECSAFVYNSEIVKGLIIIHGTFHRGKLWSKWQK